MTTVQIKLPDELVQEAERAGLLLPERIESLLREQLRSKRIDRLFDAMERMQAEGHVPRMSPEQVSEEMDAMRKERRGRQAR